MNLNNILSRSAETITAKRAVRLTTVGTRTSNDYLEVLVKQKEGIEEKIDDLLDLSARVDVNQGQEKLTNEKMEEIVNQYHHLREKLHLLDQKITVARIVNNELTANQTIGTDDEDNPTNQGGGFISHE